MPDVYFGNPFLANDQSAIFYPFHWLTLPLTPIATLSLGFLVHLHLAAAGTHAFCRRLGASPVGAAVAGLSYGFGGYLLSRQQFPSLAYTIAWLPWLFWAAQRLRVERREGLLWLAGLTAVQWLAGHAQMSVMQLTFVALWLLSQVRDDGWRPTRDAALAVLAGTVAASVQLLPTFELLKLSPRAEFDVAEAARFNLPPWQLPLLLFPKLFGTPTDAVPYLGVGPYWEVACYVGVTVAPFTLAGRRQRAFWWTIGGLGMLLAFGTYTPLYAPLTELIPLLKMFHDPARFTLYAIFGAAVLAADGVGRGIGRRELGLIGAAAALVVLVGLLLPLPSAEASIRAMVAASPSRSVPAEQVPALAAVWRQSLLTQGLLAAGLLAAVAAVRSRARWLLAVVALDLVWAGLGLNPTVPKSELARDPVPAEVPAGALIYVPSAPLEPRLAREFSLAQVPREPELFALRRALPANVNVGTGVAQVLGYDPLRGAAVVAWLNETEALDPAARRARLAAVGVAGEWRGGVWTPWPEAEGLAGGRSFTRPTPQRWVIAGSGPVTVTQPPFPGWRGDRGRPAATSPATTRWRASGDELRLRYQPTSVKLGLFASLVMLAGAFAAGVGSRYRRVTCRSDE